MPSALTNVPARVGTTGEEAAKLSNVLFPEGVVFTTYDAGALWAASRVLLERIDEEGLRARLDAIVHPSVMQAIERAFEDLGAAVGLDGHVTKLPPKRALLEATRDALWAGIEAARGRFERTLHGSEPRLPLPAGEGTTVVFELEGETGHARALADGARKGKPPSRRPARRLPPPRCGMGSRGRGWLPSMRNTSEQIAVWLYNIF